MRLKDKTAIVTGSGKGIGKHIAIGLAKEGASVVICSRTQSDIDATIRTIEDFGGIVYGKTVDLSKAFQYLLPMLKKLSFQIRMVIRIYQKQYQ